jgi:hypothetical protein
VLDAIASGALTLADIGGSAATRALLSEAEGTLSPLQAHHGPCYELRVGLLDRFFPDLEFRLISSPPHPFRLVRRRLPGIPSFASELAVQFRRPSTEAIRALFALAPISEAVGLAAPEMPSAIWQEELRSPAAGSGTICGDAQQRRVTRHKFLDRRPISVAGPSAPFPTIGLLVRLAPRRRRRSQRADAAAPLHLRTGAMPHFQPRLGTLVEPGFDLLIAHVLELVDDLVLD